MSRDSCEPGSGLPAVTATPLGPRHLIIVWMTGNTVVQSITLSIPSPFVRTAVANLMSLVVAELMT